MMLTVHNAGGRSLVRAPLALPFDRALAAVFGAETTAEEVAAIPTAPAARGLTAAESRLDPRDAVAAEFWQKQGNHRVATYLW